MKECPHVTERCFRVEIAGEMFVLCTACRAAGRFAPQVATYPKATIDNRALAADVDDLLALREHLVWLTGQVAAIEDQLIRDILTLHDTYNTDTEYLSWGDIAGFLDVKSNYLKGWLNGRNVERAVVSGGSAENRARRAAAIRQTQKRRAKTARPTRVGSDTCDSEG